MGATTTEGTGYGAVPTVKPPIYNGVVKAENISQDALVSYHVNLEATGNITADGKMTSNGLLTGNSGAVIHGNVNVTGDLGATRTVRGLGAGQLLNTAVYTFNTGNITTSAGTETQIFSCSYTPVYNYSTLIIDVDGSYTAAGSSAGAGDAFTSYLKVGSTQLNYKYQFWGTSAGQGTRSGTLTPIRGLYDNSATTSKTISFSAIRSVGDDSVTFDTDSMTVRVMEISRGIP